MLRSREFLYGLGAMGAAQFLWTVLGALLWAPPGTWVLASATGIGIAGGCVAVGGAIALAIREDTVSFGKAMLWNGTGAYLGMVLTVVLMSGGLPFLAILFGLGLLLPPIAAGAVAGEAVRRLRSRSAA